MLPAENISGTIVNSYVACKRKSWLTSRNISALKQNLHILMGSAYADNRENTTRQFGGIEIDEISKGKHVFVKEYKKSFSNIEASKMQLLFYMYTLKKELNLKKVEGFVISEETNEKAYLLLDDENTKKVENLISDVLRVVNDERPPVFERTALCLHCGHNFYCL
ncbi:MAG: CRISPR-associated exonuclease Cas4 [Campylobacterota bacterium]|nr:CRISPR-associated exonuclease Cas4 [Campylobacterota bacterium]